MANEEGTQRVESRRLETYARTLLDAARSEDRVFENLTPLQADVGASPEVLSVLSSMAANGDMDKLGDVLDLYRNLIDEDKRVASVHITTAIPLDDELRGLIKAKCEADLECDVFMVEHVDPSIVGGIVISARGRRRDVSVRHQLEAARDIMTGNVKKSEV